MSEDDPQLERETAQYLFEEQLIDIAKFQPADPHCSMEHRQSRTLVSLDEIVRVLAEKFVPIGNHLMAGSRKTLLDQLTAVSTSPHGILLLTSADPDAPARGYAIRPKELTLLYAPHEELSCAVIDNIPPCRRDPFERRPDSYENGTVYVEDSAGNGLSVLTTQFGHNPLLLFPHGSRYADQRLRNTIIDAFCKDDLSIL